ncbi:MAG: RIP metalloprotease RseP [Lachnospiraceae bacterium]|nr:RIP metalloprotease RseP [Lachnospiraceae bacterium]
MSILIAIIIFGLIIFFHELGHFLLAKKAGITVTEFSIGMGPRIASFVKGGTRYSLKILPIGGSCMMLGEDDVTEQEGSFNSKNVWERISVIVAGPFFNFILAFLLSLVMVGLMGYDPAVVTSVTEGQAAESAGLQSGDVITKIDGHKVVFGREVALYFMTDPAVAGETIEVEYERDGKSYATTLVPENIQSYKLGFGYTANDSYVEVGSLVEGYPLAEAGMQAGDVITAINGVSVSTGKELEAYFSENPLGSEAVTITYVRNSLDYDITVTPKMVEGVSVGFTYNTGGTVKTDALGVIKYSFYEVKYVITSTFKSLGMLFTGKANTSDMAGPVRIVSELNNTVEVTKSYGIVTVIGNLLSWAILISANLGVMNLLPIPALDGGRLVFLLIEAFRGKPIDREKEGYVHMIGFILLMALMVFVFYNDIRNIF